MADLAFILLLSGVFALCGVYIRGLDRLLKADDESPGRAKNSDAAIGENR